MSETDKQSSGRGTPGGTPDPMARTVIIPSPSNLSTPRPEDADKPATLRSSLPEQNLDFAIPKSGESFDPSAYTNPLVRAAGPILLSAIQVKDTLTNPDPGGVRKRMSAEIRAFDSNAKAFGVSIPQTNAARYILSTFIDEVVMSTPWGAKSGWSARSLLSEFHGETSGGAKVFTVIDRALAEPGNHGLLLELAYIVLSLGFEGQYRIRNAGALAKVQSEIYRAIRAHNPSGETELSPNWKGEQPARSAQFMKLFPLWLIALCGAMLMVTIYTAYAIALNNVREPVYSIAQSIADQGPPVLEFTPPPAVTPFDLEARLAPYVGNGLDVRIDNGVALITLVGRVDGTPLFRSNDVRLHRRAEDMLRKIADVLIELQTPVTITGHTDGQGGIQSNRVLSERRAETVFAELTRADNVDPTLFETRGFGSNQPIVADETSDADRARNRRVEIRFRVPDEMEVTAP